MTWARWESRCVGRRWRLSGSGADKVRWREKRVARYKGRRASEEAGGIQGGSRCGERCEEETGRFANRPYTVRWTVCQRLSGGANEYAPKMVGDVGAVGRKQQVGYRAVRGATKDAGRIQGGSRTAPTQ